MSMEENLKEIAYISTKIGVMRYLEKQWISIFNYSINMMNKLSIILINRNKGIGRVRLCKILTISTEFLRIEDKN